MCVMQSYGPSMSVQSTFSRSSWPSTSARARQGDTVGIPTSDSWCAMPELLVYVQALDGVACAFERDECVWMRWEGSQQCVCTSSIGANRWTDKRVPMVFRDELWFGNYVKLRAQLLLYKQPYIQSEPNTRICATSATNATNCHTCQLDKSYVLVHCPIHCIHSPPSEVPSGWVHQSQGFQNGNPLSHTPISVQ